MVINAHLLPPPVDALFRTLDALSSAGSRLVLDYVCALVLRGEMTAYGEAGTVQTVEKANERWDFGLEPESVGSSLSAGSTARTGL